MPWIDEIHGKSTRFENSKERYSVHVRRFQTHSGAQLQYRSLALCHAFFHHFAWNAAMVRVHRYTPALNRDSCFRGLTNVADVTGDYAYAWAGTFQ
jgi:hypothetical protein